MGRDTGMRWPAALKGRGAAAYCVAEEPFCSSKRERNRLPTQRLEEVSSKTQNFGPLSCQANKTDPGAGVLLFSSGLEKENPPGSWHLARMTFVWLSLAMLLLFLALTFLSSLLIPTSNPPRPAPAVTFLPGERGTCLLLLRDTRDCCWSGQPRVHTRCRSSKTYRSCGKIKPKKVNGVFSTIYSPHWGVRMYCTNFGMRPRNV